MRSPVARYTTETLAWWMVLTVIYLASLTTAPTADIVAAVVVSLPCAALGTLGRRAAKAGWQFGKPELRAAFLLPVAVIADTARLFALLARPATLRRNPGTLREFVLPDEPLIRQAGRAAGGGAILSASPGTLLVDDDPQTRCAHVHSLVEGPPDLPEAVWER